MRKFIGIFAVVGAFAAVLPAQAATTITYEYDNLGRLTKMTYSTGRQITYSYDATGNRTTQVTG
jgi:YD repeat-containing protein